MIQQYRALFATPGTGRFTVAAFVSRFPMAMLALGIVLLISELTGEYAMAGAVAATTMVAYTLTAPIAGRLADRHGQAWLLLPQAGLHFIGVAGLIAAAEFQAPAWTLFVAGALCGVSRPPAGSMVRTRWKHALSRSDQSRLMLQTAFSLESVLDEFIFVAGPIIVIWLATSVHYLAGLALCLVATVGGTAALALQRSTEPPVVSGDGRAGTPLRIRGMPTILMVLLLLGSVFGSVDLIIVAYAELVGAKPMAGPVLGVFALGSMLAGVWYGSRVWRSPLKTRYTRTLTALMAGTLLLLVPVITPIGPLLVGLLLFVAGLAISPLMITTTLIVERILPDRTLTEGMTWLSTTSTCGMAAGGGIAGWLVDAVGARPAFLFPLATGVAAFLIGTLAAPSPAPTASAPNAPTAPTGA